MPQLIRHLSLVIPSRASPRFYDSHAPLEHSYVHSAHALCIFGIGTTLRKATTIRHCECVSHVCEIHLRGTDSGANTWKGHTICFSSVVVYGNTTNVQTTAVYLRSCITPVRR